MMESKRDIQYGVGALLGFQIITAFGAIGVTARMGPAIERILKANVSSIEAAEEMLAVIALAQVNPTKQDLFRGQFDAALGRARRAVTEQGEAAAVAAVERNGPKALAGDRAAMIATVRALRRSVEVNRNAMLRADEEATRLASAGAWSAVFLALVAFAVSVVVAGRLRSRLLAPVAELCDTLARSQGGDHLRRCQVAGAPSELKQAMEAVNALLDFRHGGERFRQNQWDDGSRALVLHLLDERTEPIAVIDRSGGIAAANKQGLALLSGPGGAEVREALREAAAGAARPEIARVTPINNAELWLCALRAAEAS
jgi:hypothetical protein